MSIRAKSNAFLGVIFELIEETLEYDFQMKDLMRVNKLSVYDILVQFRWLLGHIIENGENNLWVNRGSIY